ncbi:hypothetical protein FEM03_17365 [Phragmitibacter flavus]|uniref:TerB family tellurite resistance protein n=1 Tax=Phragmitibacter flavus TaxID=2576071 RepID=A0A5R8KBV3_9BACT|nr:hypothetical protein [Phragmitibacter flavus]TLD69415.1 hypothetical protein FEM03_17365 [Phragmitibacter flavus]
MTQQSRQAIIQLLFLALYRDNHVSLAEDRVFNDALESLDWESASSRESFIFTSFDIAREAAIDPEKAEALFHQLTSTINEQGGSTEAFTWLSKVLSVDGLTSSEERFLNRIQSALFPESSDIN